VGKCVVITSATPKNEQGGFYCEVCIVCDMACLQSTFPHSPAQVCDCTLKDSVAWLDHINGKKHNRALGCAEVYIPSLLQHLIFGRQIQHEG
jgi:U4/U6.U5 tri-snRNP component SNU23